MNAPAVALLLLAAGVAAAADAPAPPAKTVLPVRVYLGFDGDGPPSAGTPPLAVDVASEIVGCPGGNQAVGAITVGVWRHEVLDACGPARAGKPPPAQAAPEAKGKVIGRTRARDPGATIRCDANDWRCAPSR